MLPGMGQIKEQLAIGVNMDAGLKRQMAIVGSMTKAEKRDPKFLNASRRRRIACRGLRAVACRRSTSF